MIALTSKSEIRPVPAASGQAPGRVLMQVKGLCKAFGGQVVLNGVELELREGEIVLLRGKNGSGKTTLLNILTGNIEPDAGEIDLFVNSHPELFRFPRRWWQELNPWDHFTPERVASEGIGRTWQDVRLFGSQPLMDNLRVATPGQTGECPWRVFTQWRRWHGEEQRNLDGASDLLRDLGLTNRDDSSADMISLGQTKRVALARAVSAGGKVLFLDEPLAGLDNDGALMVLQHLRHYASVHGVTLVIVEHVWNVHHILGFATTRWTLHNGTITAENLRTGNPVPDNDTPATETNLQELVSSLRQVETLALPHGAALSVYRLPENKEPGDTLLEVADLVVRRGRRPVIGENGQPSDAQFGLSFSLRAGDFAILQAPNGWGKTTLFEALAGILPSTHGTIRLLGKDTTGTQVWERSQAGLYLLRADNRAFPSLTVGESLALSGTGTAIADLEPFLNFQLRQLSGGERQAVRMRQLVDSQRQVYLLDEPFSALDGQSLRGVFRAIRKLAGRGRTAVLVAIPLTDEG